jgi:hypothetical protein
VCEGGRGKRSSQLVVREGDGERGDNEDNDDEYMRKKRKARMEGKIAIQNKDRG